MQKCSKRRSGEGVGCARSADGGTYTGLVIEGKRAVFPGGGKCAGLPDGSRYTGSPEEVDAQGQKGLVDAQAQQGVINVQDYQLVMDKRPYQRLLHVEHTRRRNGNIGGHEKNRNNAERSE